MADIHLPIRPGTDALLTRAMISIILKEGRLDQKYLDQRVSGFEAIESWFKDFDAESAIRVCDLDYDQVREVCRLFATRRSCIHSDLGILMNRHSTVTSYLEVILLAVCGRICVPGGNMIPGSLKPRGRHTDERDENTWRTMATDIPAVCGFFPPNVMPEEIMDEGPEHLRAVIVSASNPLRSYADTKAYEEAFNKLDLLVAIDISMTETASLAHYVLPARSAFESWDGSFMPLSYPEIFCQIRRPIIEPDGEQREAGEVFLLLAEAMGKIPPIPSDLYKAAEEGYGPEYRQALRAFLDSKPESANTVPFVMAKTLGHALGAVNLASLCATLQSTSDAYQQCAARAGFDPGAKLPDDLYKAIMVHPEGLWVGKTDTDNNFGLLGTGDGRINVHIPELEDWVLGIDADREEKALEPDPAFPLILMAGRHFIRNANTLMRNPVWNKGSRACTLTMHPDNADDLGVSDGTMVRVFTEAGDVEVELQVTGNERPGHVTLPHGFGLQYQGKTYGVNVNYLTKNTHRDPMFGTPFHRYVPCRIEKA
jgi:anaerobic selenocysteine-containing dehydrogenase